jgi:hypothetical protein
LASIFAFACGAKVPASFTPPPPHASFEDIEVRDHADADEIVVLAFGDAGMGSNDQRDVGRRMAEVCASVGCDMALMLGDNFYDRGVRAPEDERWDRVFLERFEEPYGPLGRLDMWAVAGNHDWYRGRSSIDTQIAYSRRSERWRMPSYDYAVAGLPEWISIYGLDTPLIDNRVSIGQMERAEAKLCGAPGWRILVGHHPVLTSGRHANRDGIIPSINRAVMPLIEKCGVRLYLSGHDHHQEHLTDGSFHQIIQGAAGGTRTVSKRPTHQRGTQQFAAQRFGFSVLRIRRQAIEVQFYGYPPGRPHAFGVIYETSIEATGPAELSPRLFSECDVAACSRADGIDGADLSLERHLR